MLIYVLKTLLASIALAVAMTAVTVVHADRHAAVGAEQTEMQDELAGKEAMDDEEQSEEIADSEDLLRDASAALDKLKAEADLTAPLERAKAVFIAPDFARAAVIGGVSGGQGVVVSRIDGGWGNPAFYNFGSVSVGAQAGASAGEIAMLLMTDEALDAFKQDTKFAVSAEAGLTIVDWSKAAEANYGKGDVILWTDTEGLFAGAEVAVDGIAADDEANEAWYGPQVTVAQILEGDVTSQREDFFAQVSR